MDKNICNICGGSYVYKNGKWICSCCDNVRQDEITNEELVLLANAATKLRMADFDSAEELYADFVKKYPKNSEGYWGLLLSKYGIKYEDDFDGKKIPTVYATSIESVLNDENYKKALALADKDTEKYYKQQANKFESIRQEWVEKASKEQPVDIFICYKDSDEEKDIARTDDSYEAQNLYTYLMSKGYSVFFSRESLRDKVAEKYEPYIFNALNTAHVMIVYSSSKEYLESTWVKNEWTRFLKKIKNKQKQENSLILAFDKMKPSDFPKVFSNVQCMNASQKTFYSDLEKHIQKVIKKATAPITRLERVEVKENVRHKRAKKLDTDIAKREIGSYNVEQLTGDEETQLKTAYKFLNRGLFADADEIITKILDKNSRNGQAILCKLLVNLEAKNIEELENHIDENVDFDELENSIGYSNKDVALQILSALKNACINEFNADNNEFALQLADFICRYNVEDVNFNNRINEVITHLVIKDEIECADKLVRTLLRTLTDNTDSYLEEVEKTIDTFKKQGHFDIASKYVDEYLEIYPTSHKMLWKKISIDLKCRNEVELTSNIFKLEDISVFEKILECTKAGQERDGYIEKLLNIIQKCAEEVTSSEDFSKCCDVFDKIIKYTTQDEKYVKLIFRYAENCQEKGQFTHAEKYYAIVIGEDEQNHNAYWKLLQSKLKVKNNKELIEQPVIITTLSEFHSAIVATGDDEKSADRYIDLKAKQLEYIEKQKILKAKKKHQRKVMSIFAACLAVIFAIGAGLYGWNLYYKSQNQLLYTLEDGTYSVRAGKYYDEKYITIPATYNGKPVTEIDENAFQNKNVQIISIPNTIEKISNNAFNGCDDLTKVEYYSANNNSRALATNSSMETIGDYAFYDCIKLEDIQLSSNLTYLGKYAFANCVSLNEITIPSSLENILEGTFKNAFNSDVKEISIPKEIEFIGKDAFNCNIENVLVDERNSIPTNWDNDWCGNSSEIEVLWSIPLTFDYEGATANIGVNKISVVYGRPFECPVPTKIGYIFDGWFGMNGADEVQYAGPDGLSIANWSETTSKTVYAKWTPNNNTLIYNGNGATSGSMENHIIATDSSDTLKTNQYVKAGYTFAGWSTTSNGEVIYEDGDTYTMGTNSSYNLYAIWAPNTNELVYNGNGATSGSIPNQQIKSDATANLYSNMFLKNGYSFAGWSTTQNGEVVYEDGATYTMGTNSSYTLYAVWDIETYVCSVKLNGGSIGHVTSIPFNITSEDYVIGTPTKAGYTFTGWSSKLFSGKVMAYTIEQGTYTDFTLEANWEANTNNIIFNGNNATSGSMENQEIKTNHSASLSINQYQRTGYRFLGWSTTLNGEVEFVDGATYTMGTNSSYTLYAVWDNSSTVLFNGNGATSGSMERIQTTTLSTIQVPNNSFVKTGYTFLGWSTTQNGSSDDIIDYLPGENFTIGTETLNTLYAVWEEGNIYVIYDANTLKGVVEEVINFAKYDKYLMIRDVDLKNEEWTPIGEISAFSGTFDGNGHVIKNLRITEFSTTIGLFAVNYGTICNLGLEDVNIDMLCTIRQDNVYVGTIAGRNEGTIYNCFVDGGTLKTDANYIGGFVGYMGRSSAYDQSITDSYASLDITIIARGNNPTSFEYRRCGGFTCDGQGSITNCFANCNIYIDLQSEDYQTFSCGKFIGINLPLTTNSNNFYAAETVIPTEADGLYDYVTNPNYGTETNQSNFYNKTWVESNLFTANEWTYSETKLPRVKPTTKSMVIYNGNGATSGEMLTEFITANTHNLTANAFERDGYTFKGWSTTQNGSVNYNNNGTLTTVEGQTKYVLYAVWEANTNNIVFNGNGATSGSMSNQQIKTDKYASLNINQFKKTGYTFRGWSTTQNGEVEFVDGATYTMGTNSSYTLYAVWEGNTNTIIFEGNGSTNGLMENQTAKSGQTITLTINQYEKQYSRFLGWATSADGEVVYEDGATYTMGTNSSYTLYAKWGKQLKQITSLETIRYDVQSGVDYYTEYVLMCDIDLNNEEWTPIGRDTVQYNDPKTFDGIFDGNGHTISNLKITSYETQYVGLFGFSEGIIKNVKIENLNINLTVGVSVYCGGIVGQTWGNVENCSVSGTITLRQGYAQSGSSFAGGIAGVSNGNDGKIIDCYTNVKIEVYASPNAAVGGITGSNSALIKNCYSVGDIYTEGSHTYSSIDVTVRAGGISGGNSGEINSCFAIGNMSTLSAHSYYGYAGGIVATDTEGTYTNNYRSNQQTVSPTSPGTGEMITINQTGTAISLSTIKTSNFIFNTLNWSSDVWEITNGNLPTLKMEV